MIADLDRRTKNKEERARRAKEKQEEDETDELDMNSKGDKWKSLHMSLAEQRALLSLLCQDVTVICRFTVI